jgi:hypothetical protein
VSVCASPSFDHRLVLIGTFITIATERSQQLMKELDVVDAAVRGVKRFFGETTLGCSPLVQDEDPWHTFFALIVKFAELYKLSLAELEEWKKVEARSKQRGAVSSPTVGSPDSNQLMDGIRHLRSSAVMDRDERGERGRAGSGAALPGSKIGGKLRGVTTGDSGVLDVFKERMGILRQRSGGVVDEDSDRSDEENSAW